MQELQHFPGGIFGPARLGLCTAPSFPSSIEASIPGAKVFHQLPEVVHLISF